MQKMKQQQLEQDIKNYLINNFDVNENIVANFQLFLNKDIKQKQKLYTKIISPYTNDELENSIDFSDASNSNFLRTRNPSRCYYPDLNFEKQMKEDFEDFCNILLQDGQHFLYQSIKIDDFYRLFAPFYHPIF